MGIREKERWEGRLRFDALSPLIESGNKAVALFACRDLTGQNLQARDLWQEKEALSLIKKQLPDGSWKYPSPPGNAAGENYAQYQTFKNSGVLIEKYGFDKAHPAIQKAAEYFFSVQTDEGDFRGIYDKQYTPNYTAAISELLVKAGYADDPRIIRAFEWLLLSRQRDGGWALTFRTQGYPVDVTYSHPVTIGPDDAKPFSHMVTGVVLRAFAAHPQYQNAPEAKHAGQMLVGSLFKNDRYADRGASKYWLQFVFPFCYTDLISALDTLSLLRFSAGEPQIEKAINWFVETQQPSGLWDFKITAGRDKANTQLWLALAVCRILKRFAGA
ncbi:MAG TPA: hypothetical protein VN446_00125 [Candidatus Acidoferrum sp.]|nr:hypothetical protein [Candidatus Acidoferrum sp.]